MLTKLPDSGMKFVSEVACLQIEHCSCILPLVRVLSSVAFVSFGAVYAGAQGCSRRGS